MELDLPARCAVCGRAAIYTVWTPTVPAQHLIVSGACSDHVEDVELTYEDRFGEWGRYPDRPGDPEDFKAHVTRRN